MQTEAGSLHELTGPRSLAAGELAELYSAVGGREIEAVEVSDDELLRELGGGPESDGHARYGAALVVSLGQAIRGGHFERRTDTVRELTGRAPLSVEELLEANHDALERIVSGIEPT